MKRRCRPHVPPMNASRRGAPLDAALEEMRSTLKFDAARTRSRKDPTTALDTNKVPRSPGEKARRRQIGREPWLLCRLTSTGVDTRTPLYAERARHPIDHDECTPRARASTPRGSERARGLPAVAHDCSDDGGADGEHREERQHPAHLLPSSTAADRPCQLGILQVVTSA